MTDRHNALTPLLDAWDRNNVILTNLLWSLPAEGLTLRLLPDSPSVGQLFTHIHFVRLVFVYEDAREFAQPVPAEEWQDEHDPERIAAMLAHSAQVVRRAVEGRLNAGQDMDVHYDHPILFVEHMLWHEGYHHGQIKMTLKALGLPLDDEVIGPLTWGVWMRKTTGSASGT